MSICDQASIGGLAGHKSTVRAASPALEERGAIPDLPKDYPRPGRFGSRSLWDAVLCRKIPRSTFVDWEKNGKIPPADKVIGRTKYWLEVSVYEAMSAGKEAE